MFKIQTLNKISASGLDILSKDNYKIENDITDPDAIILRSYKMHDMKISKSTLAIARAGAGVNNIPVDKCTEQGIVVFNTPGANANSVKEMVIASLIISARNIPAAINWTNALEEKGEELSKTVEKGKSLFAGSEIAGKRLGVIGLGAIGVMVSNAALAMGMKVTGYDPHISVESAWGLSRGVKKGGTLEDVLSISDIVTLHMPLNDDTKEIINKKSIAKMKDGAVILNFARGHLVNKEDLKAALKDGKIKQYVTDFPEEDLLKIGNVMCVPHLGASTAEAEENCAAMAAEQLKEYLETGNIKNSVNFPECTLSFLGKSRIAIINKNIPNIIAQISSTLASENINIAEYFNKHRNDIAYNIVDTDSLIPEKLIQKLKEIEGVIAVRIIDVKK